MWEIFEKFILGVFIGIAICLLILFVLAGFLIIWDMLGK